MCLTIKNLKSKVSKKDITCYKVLIEPIEGSYYTPFLLEPVELPKQKAGIQQINITRRVSNVNGTIIDYNIEGGFVHTFKNLIDAQDACKLDVKAQMKAIGAKYHIFECVIPEGTEYYEGKCGFGTTSYASEMIEFVECVYSWGEFNKDDTNYDRVFKLQMDHMSQLYNSDLKTLRKIFDYCCPGFLCATTDDIYRSKKLMDQLQYSLINDHLSPREWFFDHCGDRDKFLTFHIICEIMSRTYEDETIDLDKTFDIITKTDMVKNMSWDGIWVEGNGSVKKITELFSKPYDYFEFIFNLGYEDVHRVGTCIIRDMASKIIKTVNNK